ncbi:glutathione hydrolase 7-like isoform X1 [Schistocerca cancellata]|uniref:glutathione hydrolase 7-like isoform X1 n=1 Tax=Schistocerca cancellata TaxID=274614 RepID=UPI0021194C75|nr:glutathione hydrolase 7-like isoform X1 [Schistocerca cancellata]
MGDSSAVLNDSAGCIKSGGVTTISGPYVSPEQTESFPLKHHIYERHKRISWRCHFCSETDENGGSLRIIITCFFTLTLAVAIALAAQIHFGDYQFTPHGSVATDSIECSTIGTDILKKGGNAVDAAVAATLCLGVVNLHVTGLGGGGFLIVYDHRKKKVLDVIDFRETAPSSLSESLLTSSEGLKAGLLVGVPGLLRGLGLVHSMHGKLAWSEVVRPSARIARNGFPVPTSLISSNIHINPQLNETIRLQNFLKNIEAGGNLTLPKLADSFEMIAANGPDVLYSGQLANAVLSAVEAAGGVMKKEDLETYQPKRRKALHSVFGSFNIIVPDSPSGGPFLLETLRKLDNKKIVGNFTEMIQALTAAMQETYRTQFNSFGDTPDNTSDHGLLSSTALWSYPEAVGSHVAAVDLNDLYVSIVSGLNTWFGSQLLTKEGFVLNNAMENFNAGSNAFAPGKRPFSLATPIIAVQKEVCGRRLISGVGDAVVGIQLLVEYITREKNISTSMEAPRFRYNPVENQIQYEAWHKPEMSNKTLYQLRLLNYKVSAIREPYQSSNLIEKVGDTLSSRSDSRGGGVASRF